MPHGNRIKETTSTKGLIDFVLDGPQTSFQGFVAGIEAEIGTRSPRVYADVPYSCLHYSALGTLLDVELGRGTVTAGTGSGNDSLARDTIVHSSNSGAKVDFGAGQKIVVCAPQGQDIVGGGGSGFVLGKTGDQTGIASTPTVVTWQTTVFEGLDCTVSLASNQVTIDSAGEWLVGFSSGVVCNGLSADDVDAAVYKNGAEVGLEINNALDGGDIVTIGGIRQYTLASTDVITFRVTADGGTVDLYGSDQALRPGSRAFGVRIGD